MREIGPEHHRAKAQGRRDSKGFARLAAIAVAFAAVLIFAVQPTPAAAKYASLIVDAESGKVLHSVNPDTRNYPASLTKMMTLYIVFERLQQRKWSLATRIKVSRRAARQPASRLGVKPGQTITVEQAILALVVKSANDVATAVAEAVSGRERDFALVMTAKARRLGMRRTIFRNASGLPHRGQMSTARDMAKLALALMRDFPDRYHYFSKRRFKYRSVTHRSHNQLLGRYAGADGFKTGYIRASGFNLVASAKRGGKRMVGVIFGGRSPKMRNRLMAKLLDKGFRLTGVRGTSGTAMAAKTASPERRRTVARTASRSAATPPSRRATPAARRTAWAIQVGAFHKRAQAMTAAVKATKRLPQLLANGRIAVVPLKKRNGRVLHRARIQGISKRQAYRACRILRDCMELTIKVPVEVASAAR